MNCKQGELAVIVRSKAGNEGRIVKCVRLASIDEILGNFHFSWAGLVVWVVDAELPATLFGTTNMFPDERMRPLRDGEGTDETLTWAGKPREFTSA